MHEKQNKTLSLFLNAFWKLNYHRTNIQQLSFFVSSLNYHWEKESSWISLHCWFYCCFYHFVYQSYQAGSVIFLISPAFLYMNITLLNNEGYYSIPWYNGQLKCLVTDQDTLMKCDQMRFIFQHSHCCDLLSFLYISVYKFLPFHWFYYCFIYSSYPVWHSLYSLLLFSLFPTPLSCITIHNITIL